jgi:hypothetical protein
MAGMRQTAMMGVADKLGKNPIRVAMNSASESVAHAVSKR